MKESLQFLKHDAPRINPSHLGSFVIVFLILLAPHWASSQDAPKTVSGFVSSTSSPEGIPGVAIAVKGTTKGVITDVNGKFSIELLPSEDVLIFSFIGFTKREISVGNQSSLTIQMEEDITTLSEVVVVGYGEQKKANLTGSVAQVDFKGVVSAPVTDPTQLLYGRLPGVQLEQTSGRPGAGANITIRGININNSNPLVVVDGMQVSSLNQVAASDIESITVLKDAASASIYGARGANGVILVTTKSGKDGKIKVDINSSMGWSSPTILPKLLSGVDYMLAINERQVTAGRAATYSQNVIDAVANGTADPDYFGGADWMKELFQTGKFSNQYLSVSGGNEKNRFLVSMQYNKQEGTLVGSSELTSYTMRAKMDSKINERISYGINIAGSLRQNRGPNNAIENNSDNSVVRTAMQMSPLRPVYFSNGVFNDGEAYNTDASGNLALTAGFRGNPVFRAYQGTDNSDNYAFNSRLYAKVKIIEGLTYEPALVYNFGAYLSESFSPTYTTYQNPAQTISAVNKVQNALNMGADFGNTFQFDNLIRFNRTIAKDHYIGVLLGHQIIKQKNYNNDNNNGNAFNVTVNGFANNDQRGLANAKDNIQVNGSPSRQLALQSFFGRLEYRFKDRYMVEANMRYDGSSQFPKTKRYGLFPAFSAGWKFGDENFIQGLKNIISDGKVRASWGRLGSTNNLGYFPYQRLYVTGQNYIFQTDATLVNGAAQTQLVDENISWETSETTDMGVDLQFFQNLNLTFDWYQRNTFDILLGKQAPWTAGNLSDPTTNLGKVQNSGWELALSYRKQTNKLTYDVGINFSQNTNKVVSLPGGKDIILTNGTILREGESIYAYYGRSFQGIFQDITEVATSPTQAPAAKPGYKKYEDISGPNGVPDGVSDNNFDRTILGNSYPEIVFGFTGSVGYKNFDLRFVFSGVNGVKRYRPFNGNNLFQGNMTTAWLNRWSPENPNNEYPLLGSETSATTSSWDFVKADYMRLKILEFGYTVPKSKLQRVGIENLRIYASANNIWTITNYVDGFDPERATANQRGEEYPLNKNLVFGLNLTF
jgi:TonB-dependent starch-binding outer membrane protein SusC